MVTNFQSRFGLIHNQQLNDIRFDSSVDSATDIDTGILLLIAGGTAPHDRTLAKPVYFNQPVLWGRAFFGRPPTDFVLRY